jgi:neural Wiskott-Aldrich syndrome protein
LRAEVDRQGSPLELRNNQAPYQGQERASPAPRLQPAPRPPVPQPERWRPAPNNGGGFTEPQPPSLDLQAPAAPPGKKRKGSNPAARVPGEPSGLLAKLLENIPQKTRLARGEIVRVRLSKEEAAQLFARVPRRGPYPQAGELACRAVTIKLSAPDGGFFIETTAPETQWIFNRPVAGEEAFGTWAWAVVANETGWQVLSMSIFARDLDANGLPSEVRLPEQAIKVRVRGNFGRLFLSLFRTLFLLLTGSALTVGVWYVLKVMGKLPH